MSKIKNGGPAHPVYTGNPNHRENGMTLRDYFAGQFLAGVAMSVSRSETLYTDRMAKDAYDVADAMLVEREK